MTATEGPAASDLPGRVLAACHAEGFELVAVAPAGVIDDARRAAHDASEAGRLDGLHWMTGEWLERATDPDAFLPGARSVLLLALPYPASEPSSEAATPGAETTGRIAAYAAGRDYHRVFEKKLRRLARFIRDDLGAAARATVDYGPLLERPLAALAGLGWLGKSTMLLVPGFGPWVMLGAVATSLDLPHGKSLAKSCGSCRRCIVACPTGALSPEGNVLDARRCISYHTIENRGPIPRDLRPLSRDWIFGCDDCLAACPVGARSTASHPDFLPHDREAVRPALAPLLTLTEEQFAERYRGRAIMRARRDGFVRNVCVAVGNVGTASDLPALAGALGDSAALVRGHAAWAIARLLERVPDASGREMAEAALQSRLAVEGDAFAAEEMRLALAVESA